MDTLWVKDWFHTSLTAVPQWWRWQFCVQLCAKNVVIMKMAWNQHKPLSRDHNVKRLLPVFRCHINAVTYKCIVSFGWYTSTANAPRCTDVASPWNNTQLLICATDDSGTVEWHFHSSKHAWNLSSDRPLISTTCKGPDSRHGEDATFDNLLLQKLSVM